MANDYWRQREEAQRLLDMRSDAEREREYSALYKRAFDDVQREIDSFYARYAVAEDISIAEAHKRVSQLDIAAYSRRAKAYVEEKNFTDKANEEMRIYNLTMKVNRLELLKAKIALELVAKGSAEERHLRATLDEATRKELDRQSGILGDTVKHGADPAQIRRIVEGDFHNAKFSERIWSNNKLLQMAIEKELQTGLIQGRRPDYKRVAQLFNASEYAAKRLLHTETKRVRTEAAKERYQENGIEDFEFMALGPTPCDICSELDGKHFPVKKMVAGENAPPMHPNCRCSTAPWVDENAYNAWLDAKASGDFDGGFSEWKRLNPGVNILLDEFTPCLRRLSDNAIVQTTVRPFDPTTETLEGEWEFDWKKAKRSDATIYALYADGDPRVQGLVSIKRYEKEKYNEVLLVESAPYNNRHNNSIIGAEYSGVGGHLFAEAIKQSYENGYHGYVFFIAKTDLVEYYKSELGAKLVFGDRAMAIEGVKSKELYEKYYGEK